MSSRGHSPSATSNGPIQSTLSPSSPQPHAASVLRADPEPVVHVGAARVLRAVADVEVGVRVGVAHVEVVPRVLVLDAHADHAARAAGGVVLRDAVAVDAKAVGIADEVALPRETVVQAAEALEGGGRLAGGHLAVVAPVARPAAQHHVLGVLLRVARVEPGLVGHDVKVAAGAHHAVADDLIRQLVRLALDGERILDLAHRARLAGHAALVPRLEHQRPAAAVALHVAVHGEGLVELAAVPVDPVEARGRVLDHGAGLLAVAVRRAERVHDAERV
mmetsp:Transcript_7927/g.24867  ORF Transcript_7927/g.24867 Transcript_7927/m.24867 type:complete len:276 (+) Transcript_7927:878-1705(+)